MSFASLLIDRMKVVQITSIGDEWNEPVGTVSAVIRCRIMYDTRLMKNYKGEEVLSAAKIFCLPADITFSHEDQVQFFIEGYAINHPIITIKQPQNSVAIHHGEIWVS